MQCLESIVQSGIQKGGRYSLKVSFTASNHINECETGDNNCSKNANCIDTECSFKCECKEGYEGDGVDCVKTEEDKDEYISEEVDEIEKVDEDINNDEIEIVENPDNNEIEIVERVDKDETIFSETGVEYVVDNDSSMKNDSGCSCNLILF
jgi:hypothetical protein